MKLTQLPLLAILAIANVAPACELCAIYNAGSARGESTSGPLLVISEQFIPFRTVQLDGKEVKSSNPSYVDSSITHIVPGYNFCSWFGLNLNMPVVHREFRRSDVRYSRNLLTPPAFFTEKGTESGLGDIALIARFTALKVAEMDYGFLVNLLGGVKFPTGDTDRLQDELEQTRNFNLRLPPNTPHDPLGHSAGSVHQHDLSPGSGSYDGVFGITGNARWNRCFLNAQLQYYLRTEGDGAFEYGDELMASGGPGAYLLLGRRHTLSLQANANYHTQARSAILGQESDRTGMTAWYMGPLVSFTYGDHFSANAGVDIPLAIWNRSFQTVPDYRLHGGVTWRF